MSTVTFRVRVAWTTDPFSGSPSWTDESSRVTSVSSSVDITRGSGDLYSSTQPSTLSLVFNNNDGRFTAGYTGSALFPNVVRGKRVRVDATVDGTNYFNRYDGYIDTLPAQWAPIGKYAEANVTCVDRLAQLGHQLVPSDIVSTTINAQSNLTDYWKFNDPAFTTVPVNFGSVLGFGGANNGLSILRAAPFAVDTASVVDFGSASGAPTDGSTAVQVTDGALLCTGRSYASSSFYATGFFRVDALDPTFGINSLLTLSDGAFNSLSVFIDGTGKLKALLTQSSGNVTVSSTVSVADAQTHMFGVAVIISGGHTDVTLYLDGVIVAFDLSLVGGGTLNWSITAVAQSAVYQVTSVASIIMAHLATFTVSPDFAAIAAAGLNGFSGETSAARFTRICALAGITPVVTGTSGTQTMGPLSNIQGQSIVALLQGVQDTEGGAFFTQTDGDIQLVPRTAFYNMAASMTLTAGQYDSDLMFIVDNSQLVNDAIGTGSSGIPQEATNAASITANGTYSVSQSLNTTSDAEVLGWATEQVGLDYTKPRVSQVTVNLWAQQSLCTTVWALEIGNRLDLSGLPPTAPASSVKLQIDGYTESFAQGAYSITFNTSRYQTGSLFIFDDATFGTFDGPGVFAY